MNNNWFKNKINSFANDDDYQKEKNKLKIAEEISQRLLELGKNKIEFAELLGTSPAYITKLLSGTSNFTLDTLYDICKVLELNLEMHFWGKKERIESQITVKQDNVQNIRAEFDKETKRATIGLPGYATAGWFRTTDTNQVTLNQ